MKPHHTMSNNCIILLLFLLVSAHAFSDSVVFSRTIHHATPEEAYQIVLQAWKQNLGLWFAPFAFILDEGDAKTGIGFVVMRIPPLGLKEGIVGRKELEDGSLTMTYKVLNPSYFTWPVKDHLGEITLIPDVDSTLIRWEVQWTPLVAWLPFFPQALTSITTFIIGWAADYVASLPLQEKAIDEL